MQKFASLIADSLSRPTTKDLAKLAGVSRATVDRVLNGREGVKQRTVDKVNAAIAQLGFERNISAANLAKSRTYRFLFVVPRSGDQFLAEILNHIKEAESAFAAENVWTDIHHIDENDPHGIAAFLATLTPRQIDGVAIMAPQTSQVRDAILRLQQRGVQALAFISNQALDQTDWVGIDNRAAGETAATLIGRFVRAGRGTVLSIAESMQSRDSLERRLGFDDVINNSFPWLTALPSIETYGSVERARQVIGTAVRHNRETVAIYILASEARVPLEILKSVTALQSIVIIAHERTPYTEAALRNGTLDGLITQNPGHLVRSAIRKMRAMADGRKILESQEKIRVEILLKTNL